jgi:hypothetical protein
VNNNSSLVQDWTTQKLKKTAESLHSSIYQSECFSSHDLLEYEAVSAELERRGYEIHETKTLDIRKAA